MFNDPKHTKKTRMKADRIITRQNHKSRFPMILSRHDSVADRVNQPSTNFGHESRDNYPSTARLDVSFCPVSWPIPFSRKSAIANRKSKIASERFFFNRKSKIEGCVAAFRKIANRESSRKSFIQSQTANRKSQIQARFRAPFIQSKIANQKSQISPCSPQLSPFWQRPF